MKKLVRGSFVEILSDYFPDRSRRRIFSEPASICICFREPEDTDIDTNISLSSESANDAYDDSSLDDFLGSFKVL